MLNEYYLYRFGNICICKLRVICSRVVYCPLLPSPTQCWYVNIFSVIKALFALFLFLGILWPLRSLPDWVRYTSYSFPMAIPADAVRSILLRGKDYCHIVSVPLKRYDSYSL